MYEIQPGKLWIGNAMDIRQPRTIFEKQILVVVDVAYEEAVSNIPRQLIYCRFPLNDGGGNQPRQIRLALQTIVTFLESGMRVLVACSAGMSRSPTISAFALAIYLRETPEKWISKIAGIRSLEVKPELWKEVSDVYQSL